MIRALMVLFFIVSATLATAQKSSDVVQWKYSAAIRDGKPVILLTAEIHKGWHLYSQHLKGDGPIPTTFVFKENPDIQFVGPVAEEKAHTAYDPNFDMEISYFEGTAVFTQEIDKKASSSATVSGSVEFMVCNDQMCYPPETIEFTFDIP